MFIQFLAIFVLLPLAELVLLIMLLRLHWGLTLAWVLATGFVGAWFVRRQGRAVIDEMRRTLVQDRLPTDVMMEGLLVLIAGGLLIAPGVITDAIGFSILIKPCRRFYRKLIVDGLKKRFRITTIRFDGRSDILEGEVVGRNGNEDAGPGEASRSPGNPSIESKLP